MARRFPFRRTAKARRPISRASAVRTFAKKKLQWVTVYNKVCEVDVHPVEACTDGEPSASLTLPLLKPDAGIAGGYDYSQLGDSVRLVKMVGRMGFLFTPSAPVDQYGGLGTFRLGLKRVEYSFADATFPTFNPLVGDPDTDGDYSEARWLWLKEKYLTPTGQLQILPPPVVWAPFFRQCVAPVDACILPEQLNNGTGYTWNVNSQHADGVILAGECHTCDESGPQQAATNTGAFPGWSMPVNYRKGLILRDNLMLTLTMAFQPPGPGTASGNLLFYGGVRALLEV